MIPQVVLPPERFVADITGVRSLISMCSFVDKQVVRLGEPPLAELANKFFPGPRGSTAGKSSWASIPRPQWTPRVD